MDVSDVMTTTVVTARTDTTFHQLVDLMLRHGISGIPVIDQHRRPIGIVTEADLVSKEAYGRRRRRVLDVAAASTVRGESDWIAKSHGLTAGAVMSAPVHTVRRDDRLPLAAAYMITTGVKRLPVVDGDGRLVGIVSRSDVLRLFHRTDEELTLDVRRVLDDPLVGSGDRSVTASVCDGVVTLHDDRPGPSHARLADAVRAHVPGVVDVVVSTSSAG